MKKLYITFLAVFLFGGGLFAQTIEVPPNLDTDFVTFISDFIEQDTAADGSQNNDTYLLQRGNAYAFTFEAKWDFDVTLGAYGDEDAGRPLVFRVNKTGGSSFPQMYSGTGNFKWDGLYIVLGEEAPGAGNYENSAFRPMGDDKTFTFNDCIIEKSRQGTIRCEGENSKIFVTNNWIRNFGDYKKLQGNGRVVDIRTTFGDTVVIHNNVIHNILDRLFIGFRMQGLNYFQYTSNTLFNHVGRHGMIQLKNTKESIIKDNLFMNPSIMGTAPSLANEQINFEGDKNFLFTLDTIIEGGSVDMSNNNVFWTDDVLEHYATFDSVQQPPVMSPIFIAALVDNTAPFYEEVLELNNVPDRAPLIQYSFEAVTFPDSTGITDIMVEPIELAGVEGIDEGYLFDFSTFDPCFDQNSGLLSATSARDGGPIGARAFCNYVSSTKESFNPLLNFEASPNPASNVVNFDFSTTKAGIVSLNVYTVQGQLIATVFSGDKVAGDHKIQWNDTQSLTKGMYIARIQTAEGQMIRNIVLQ